MMSFVTATLQKILQIILSGVGVVSKKKRETENAIGTIRQKRVKRVGIFVVASLVSAVSVFFAGAIFLPKAGANLPENALVGRQPDGSVLVTTNQVITPVGKQIEFSGRPVAVTLSPNGRTAAFLNGAGGSFIVLVDVATGTIKQQFNPPNGGTSFDGIVYSKDGKKLFASDASSKLVIANVASDGTLSLDSSVDLPSSSYPGGLALSPDGQTLYIALSRNNSLGVFNLASRKLVAEIPVGNAPHAVLVVGNKAYVSNQGGRKAIGGDFTNESSGTAIVADSETGGSATGTVSVVNLVSRTTAKNIRVGLQPTGMMKYKGDLFVVNTHSDSISVIDTSSDQVVKTIAVKPFANAPFGSLPTAVAMAGDNKLIVSLGTNNALATYDWQSARKQERLEGLVPTGWYPGALAVDDVRQHLVVANVKGVGSLGPNFTLTIESTPPVTKVGKSPYAYLGSTSLISYPQQRDLPRYTAQVVSNNGWDKNWRSRERGKHNTSARAIPQRIGDPSLIKHLFYIIKENRTYDQVFGDDPRGNGSRDLVVFGANTTPNLHALSRQFPLLDNLYDSGVISADGHQWNVQAIAPDYIEKAFSSFARSYPFNGGDSLAYAPSGFLWQNAIKYGRSVRVYGEYANQFSLAPGATGEFGKWIDWYNDSLILEGKKDGQLHVPVGTFQTKSDVPSLDRLLNRNFPNYTNNIPDIYRADIFLSEFEQYVANGNLPELVIMALNTDHTSGNAVDTPTPRAQVADNDLAVGRIIDAISHSPYWHETAIFIVEDDAQNGVDHVDGHRTEALVISPYAKHGIVDSTYYTQISMVRTMEQILGLPPMNQMDLAALPMYNAFTDQPDLAPYNVLPNQIPLNELNPGSTTAMSEVQRSWIQASNQMFGKENLRPDEQNEELLNRAIWYSVKGFDKSYPGDAQVLLPNEVITQSRDD